MPFSMMDGTPDDYVKLALRTESPVNDELKARLVDNARLLHAAMGICTEAGELMDQLKKAVFYNREIDLDNIEEELGDLMWYVALMCDECNCSLAAVMAGNIQKLKKRYPDKYTHDHAVNRNTGEEMEALKRAMIEGSNERG